MTSCNPTSALEASDIIKIITSCRENGVLNFQFGDLKLSLDAPPVTGSQVIEQRYPEDPARTAEDLKTNEYLLRQEELELMRIQDPYEYEQMVSRHELEAEQNA